ncbi:hypothetical protein [Jiangella ureilytica]|nr:hypothetical protein [Jiangella ureilytica]
MAGHIEKDQRGERPTAAAAGMAGPEALVRGAALVPSSSRA